MILCYFDASAWSKRYSGEHGYVAVDFLFDDPSVGEVAQLASSALSVAEVFSILVRFRNRTSISDQDFSLILQRIVADEKDIFWLSIPEDAFRRGIQFILKHSLNATDAALLDVLLNVQNQLRRVNGQVWLISSDKRFLRAANDEGIFCLDPEINTPREIRKLFGR